jgi:putative ABC transport system permease protein
LGDKVQVMGSEFSVVGLSGDTTSWMTSFFFMRKVDAERLFRAPGATSFLVVTPNSGTNPIELQDRLNKLPLPGANAVLKSDVIANDHKLFARFFSAPLQLMVVVAFLVGTMVVGLVIYTATVERQREYGVLRAIGARNGLLYRVVIAQALIAAGAGSILGVGFAVGAAQIIMAVRPQFLVTLEPAVVGWALLLGLGMALLAALFPARIMSGLAPAEVFRR